MIILFMYIRRMTYTYIPFLLSAFILWWNFLIRLFFFLNYLQICSLLRGGIAERGGVRVGHRIIEINGQSVVAVPHEKIVNLLATSVGEVRIYIVYTVLSIFYRKRCKQYGDNKKKNSWNSISRVFFLAVMI